MSFEEGIKLMASFVTVKILNRLSASIEFQVIPIQIKMRHKK